MDLPSPIDEAVRPLFDALPPDHAMAQLVVAQGPRPRLVALVESVLARPAFVGKPALAAGLWLYIDDLDRSHRISQSMDDETGAFWHGIMHRREGDFANSHYWFRRTGRHPAMMAIEGYDPHAFIEAVEVRHRESPPELIVLQRTEWEALFSWCANHG